MGIDLPPPLKVFLPDQRERIAGKAFTEPELAISSPPDQSEVALDETSDGTARPLVVKAEGGVLPLTWMIDDEPVATEPHSREASLALKGRGFSRVSVVDATGRADRITLTIR